MDKSIAGYTVSNSDVEEIKVVDTICGPASTSSVDVQQVSILGATGSIGVSTLNVLAQHPERFSVFALTANTNVKQLFKQCRQFVPRYAVMADEVSGKQLQQWLLEAKCPTEVLVGVQALEDIAAHNDVDTVMAAIVGAAGLLPTMAAVKAGKKVLLANKESLVMAGSLFMDAVSASGAQLLPIDSEHNAIFQCLPTSSSSPDSAANSARDIRRVLLTGSGGPLRTWSSEAIRCATPDQACRHPNWSMGKKISVDSASLMNKGLEFIEAKWLFDLPPSMIDVVIHPQSIIHSMVEYVDGSVLAQLGNPDMRTPIAYGLAYPQRIDAGVSSLDIIAAAQLDFAAPDMTRFPALALAIEAANTGVGAAVILNAANEVAVAAFLNEQLSFGQMIDTLQEVMEIAQWNEPNSLEAVLELDLYSRSLATNRIALL